MGLHEFNPPPNASSYKRDNEVLHQRGKSLGVEQCVQDLKYKGMKTHHEVNNFSRVTFLSKFHFFSLYMVFIWLIYNLQMELEGQVRNFPVYGRSMIMYLMT
jgi:hypothetical protein